MAISAMATRLTYCLALSRFYRPVAGNERSPAASQQKYEQTAGEGVTCGLSPVCFLEGDYVVERCSRPAEAPSQESAIY